MSEWEVKFHSRYKPLPAGWVIICDGSHYIGWNKITDIETNICWNKWWVRRWIFELELK